MESGKKAMESVKETTSNIAASAKSGMDKTKATVQEKVDKMRAHDDYEKALATEKKDEHMTEAELLKQQAVSHNTAEKDVKIASYEGGPPSSRAGQGSQGLRFGTAANITTTTGPQYSPYTEAQGQPTRGHQISALPGHGTGEPIDGHVVGGTETGSQPHTTEAEVRYVGGRTGTGYVD